jgi:hypothetical protein
MAVAAILMAAVSPITAQIQRGAGLPQPLPLFPPDNWWNVDISSAPVDVNSTSFINSILARSNNGLHPDFGGDDGYPEVFGMIYITVPGSQPLVPITWTEFGDQSDDAAAGRPGGYPIPVEARTQDRWIEGGWAANVDPGGDRHMLLVDRDNRILYELYHTFWNDSLGRWEAGSGAIYPLDSNARRPDGWTSADAAGLAILPGLVRYDEAFGAAPIKHAFRVTLDLTHSYVFPASHDATTGDSTNLPLGARLRLKASKNITGYTPEVQRIFQAMKTYGLIVADNGTDLFITGAYDTRWDNGVLNPAFKSLKASDFEVVQLGWRPAVATSAGPLDYYTLTPCRLLDTRNAYGPYGGPPILPGQRILKVTGQCGIPATAKALAVNVTVVDPSSAGNLRFFPGNADPGNTSAINYAAGLTRANNALVMLSSSGSGALGISNSGAQVHVTLDVFGYFQ